MTQQDEDSDGENKLKEAYQQFMLKGRHNNDKVERRGAAASVSSNESCPKETTNDTSLRRNYWKHIKSFQSTLQQDWIHVDDELFKVLESITNLRQRINLESRRIVEDQSSRSKQCDWKFHGYRNNAVSSCFTVNDIQMALDHDLEKHESMLQVTRRLLAALARGQTSLGRRFEQLLVLHSDAMETFSLTTIFKESEPKSIVATMNEYVSRFTCLLRVLAAELYRKQGLLQRVFDSCTDHLLYDPDDNGIDPTNPRLVAEACVKEWPRGCRKSLVDVELLDYVMKLGQPDSSQ